MGLHPCDFLREQSRGFGFRFGEWQERFAKCVRVGEARSGIARERAFKRDELLLRKRSARHSYWVRREPPGPPPDSFHNQF